MSDNEGKLRAALHDLVYAINLTSNVLPVHIYEARDKAEEALADQHGETPVRTEADIDPMGFYDSDYSKPVTPSAPKRWFCERCQCPTNSETIKKTAKNLLRYDCHINHMGELCGPVVPEGGAGAKPGGVE